MNYVFSRRHSWRVFVQVFRITFCIWRVDKTDWQDMVDEKGSYILVYTTIALTSKVIYSGYIT